jgi:hypothetical protein
MFGTGTHDYWFGNFEIVGNHEQHPALVRGSDAFIKYFVKKHYNIFLIIPKSFFGIFLVFFR